MRYTDYVNSGKLQTDICLDEFLKLFMNHKSTKGEEITELRKVFKIIGKTSEAEDPSSIPTIDREDFISFLKSKGEAFKEKDFKNHVMPLFQQNLSIDKTDTGEACENYGIEESSVSYESFTKDILKIKEDINIFGTEIPYSSHQNVTIVVDEVEPSIKA